MAAPSPSLGLGVLLMVEKVEQMLLRAWSSSAVRSCLSGSSKRNLLDKDMFSKSDPRKSCSDHDNSDSAFTIGTRLISSQHWSPFRAPAVGQALLLLCRDCSRLRCSVGETPFGRTEVIDNTLNPDFVRKFIVDYFFEEKQNLRFDLYDVDSKSPDLSKHDFLGQAFCTLGEIVGSPASRLEKSLTIGAFSLNSRTGKPMPAVSNGGVPGKKCGTIILSAEELSNCREILNCLSVFGGGGGGGGGGFSNNGGGSGGGREAGGGGSGNGGGDGGGGGGCNGGGGGGGRGGEVVVAVEVVMMVEVVAMEVVVMVVEVVEKEVEVVIVVMVMMVEVVMMVVLVLVVLVEVELVMVVVVMMVEVAVVVVEHVEGCLTSHKPGELKPHTAAALSPRSSEPPAEELRPSQANQRSPSLPVQAQSRRKSVDAKENREVGLEKGAWGCLSTLLLPHTPVPDSLQDVATMQFCANKLDKKDFFGKSDPFLVFYRSNEDGTFTICHKTEVMKNTLNPVWQTFSIPVRALCNGDYDRTIKVEVYDWDRDGSHDFIGEFTTSYRELARGQSQFNIYEVVNPKKKMKKKKYVNSGTVTLLSFAVESECTFLDYIKGGTQINFTVAIDFTASNGNPSQSTSLHYMSPYQLNAYALALTAVGEIIQHYDSDKMFPALGFGAKLPPDGRVSHEFPLNGNQENPSCCGIDGILEAYHRSLRTVQLYGPTNFAPVVTHVARSAAAVQDGSQYSVLLIITDGVISDMAQTKEAIVNAAKLPMSIIIIGVGQAEFDGESRFCPLPPWLSRPPEVFPHTWAGDWAAKLPMSIIIIGVGQAEFDAMVELDGDDVRISSRGKLAERDIVQFVPFRDYVDRTGNHVLSMARLARDVLAEIPDQLVSYMKAQGIRPRPPPAAPAHSPPQSPARTPPASPTHVHI
ncbi:Copine-5 [Tupaia chinensis]|uniref:Copine-5 n=2 Tax=Boreoeutheria TaxID=1437010 RepID=L9KTH8_TUPCH|nr:Copine-5 [Tupaia chinensis]